MVARLVGNSLWSASHLFGFGIVTPVAPQDIAYAISYPLLVGAMLHLVALATRRITLVSTIDAGAVMLSVGTLAWYFLLGLQYMRRRAGEVGADLDVISARGRGTTVQVRFRKRQSTPTRRRAIRQAPRVRAECSL